MPARDMAECRTWAVVKVLVRLGRSCDVDCTMMNSSLRWGRPPLLQDKDLCKFNSYLSTQNGVIQTLKSAPMKTVRTL